jgi:hypothetical protein
MSRYVARIALVALALAGVLIVLQTILPIGIYMAIPVTVAILVVALFRPQPGNAGLMGALGTFAAVFGVAFALIPWTFLSGDFESGESCESFCPTNTQGFVLATVIALFISVPLTIAGGIISALTALITRRPAAKT